MVVLDEQRALVANGHCLLITDISDMTPIPLPQAFAVSWTQGVDVAGDYAYLACGGEGLKIVDISDQMNLNVVGGVATADTVMDVSVEGDLAVVADQDAGLAFIDVGRDRTAPFVAPPPPPSPPPPPPSPPPPPPPPSPPFPLPSPPDTGSQAIGEGNSTHRKLTEKRRI